MRILVLLAALVAGSAAAQPVAVTIDDVPFVGGVGPGDSPLGATRRILAALKAHDVTATAFVVCRKRGSIAPFVSAWAKAGHGIGNHSTNHRWRDKLSDAAFRREVVGCRDRLAALGHRGPWFRFPYLSRGKTPARRDASLATVAEAGLRVAPVTIDTSEWALAKPYVAALKRRDDAAATAIGRAFVDHLVSAGRHFRRLAPAGTPHVLLLHANAVAADWLGPALKALKADGFEYAPLETVMKHPLYARPDRYAGSAGISWLYRVEAADSDEAARRWRFDNGQLTALRRRVGASKDDSVAYPIGAHLTVRRLTERVHLVVHEKPWPANSLVVEVPGGLLFVDTPYTDDATYDVLDWAHTRFGPGDRTAIATHFHDDAAGGFRALNAHGVTTIASTHTAGLLEKAGRPGPAVTFDPGRGYDRRLGSDRLEVVFPGHAHSPDNVVVRLSDHGVLFGGCMLKAGRHIGNRADADVLRWMDALSKVKPLVQPVVVPGHGEDFTPKLIANTRRVLVETRAKDALKDGSRVGDRAGCMPTEDGCEVLLQADVVPDEACFLVVADADHDAPMALEVMMEGTVPIAETLVPSNPASAGFCARFDVKEPLQLRVRVRAPAGRPVRVGLHVRP